MTDRKAIYVTQPYLPPLDEFIPYLEQIWDSKYRLKQPDGAPVDLSVEDSWRRVARDLARQESDPALWEDRFYQICTGSKVCLFCFFKGQ